MQEMILASHPLMLLKIPRDLGIGFELPRFHGRILSRGVCPPPGHVVENPSESNRLASF
jgi:hypothetical protein